MAERRRRPPFLPLFPSTFLSRFAAAAARLSNAETVSCAANGRLRGEFVADAAEAAATRLVGAKVTAAAVAGTAALQQVP